MALDRADFYDAELAQHNRHLRIAAAVRADDRVLDIGCGAGQTTREAARAATQGEAVGLDISAEMLEEARRRSAAERLRNVVSSRATRNSTHSRLAVSTSASAGLA